MNVVVLIKQVPDTDRVRIDPEKGTMVREGFEPVMNTFDLHALELALRIRENVGGSVTVVSMGPPNTEEVLREAISLGADEAILLTDRLFAGADTLATSVTLTKALEMIDYDLIIAGERATDGETGQVGSEVGALLDLPVVTYVSKMVSIEKDHITVERTVEEGTETWEVPLPALITVSRSVAEPRLPTLSGKKRALKKEIKTLGASDLGLNPSEIGLRGSPTRVVKVFNVKVTRRAEIYEGESISEGIEKIVEILRGYVS